MNAIAGQHFAELLRAHRLRRGVTQQQLAELSTVSVRAIRDLEIGRARRPRRDTVRLIADGLRMSGSARAAFELAARAEGPAPTLETEFAPPPALDGLVGRAVEVAALRSLLETDGQRLVTIVGLAGAGKTRLALELAAATAGALWIQADYLVQSFDELVQAIGHGATLLVLDGHPGGAAGVAEIVTLLQECRALQVLLTARTPLEIPGEWTVPLAPLAIPDHEPEPTQRGLAGMPSVRLLLRHARKVRPGFGLTAMNTPAVAALCRLLDGIPVALEAVADWFLVYDPEEIIDLVQVDPFGALDHRSCGLDLRTVVEEAVASLGPAECALLDRLARVDGGWPRGDAVWLLQRLLHRGVVRRVGAGGQARFRVLNLVQFIRDERAAQQRRCAIPGPRDQALAASANASPPLISLPGRRDLPVTTAVRGALAAGDQLLGRTRGTPA